MSAFSTAERRAQATTYHFRDIHPHVRFGTASDRYAGWIGQIYPEDFASEVKMRKRKLGGQTFEERTLPIASVESYFEHFGVLELDFTFYRPLIEPDGTASNNFFVLEQYAAHAPGQSLFFLKAPQTFFARLLRRSKGGETYYEDNPHFLNAEAFVRQFLDPARHILGERLGGIIFEQEYQRKSDSVAPEQNVAELANFFGQIPNTVQAHIELRSPQLLVPAYFDWLEEAGIGFVFSHWTWLPKIREQWRMSGKRLTAGDGSIVSRLLTPLRVPYAKAYANAYPFDKAVPAIAETKQAREMVLDATALAYQAEAHQGTLFLMCNNRAWGNAPALAQAVANRILDEEERRAAR